MESYTGYIEPNSTSNVQINFYIVRKKKNDYEYNTTTKSTVDAGSGKSWNETPVGTSEAHVLLEANEIGWLGLGEGGTWRGTHIMTLNNGKTLPPGCYEL